MTLSNAQCINLIIIIIIIGSFIASRLHVEMGMCDVTLAWCLQYRLAQYGQAARHSDLASV